MRSTRVGALVAGFVFAVALGLALLPKAPVSPFDLHPFVRRLAGEISDKYWLVLVAGGLFTLWRDRQLLWQLLVTLLVAQVAIELLKWSVGEMRPDGRMLNSFTSGHTTATFAYATVMSLRFQRGWLWFLFGGTVGLSRILVRAHWWHDVVGGAALGYLIGLAVTNWWQRCSRSPVASDVAPPPHPAPSEPAKPPGSQTAAQDE